MITLAHTLPTCIEIGADTTLTAVLRGTDDSELTASSGSLVLCDGSETLASAAATSLGPPASYSLAGSVTSSRSPSERILERWTFTIAGTVYHFQRAGYLVRTAFHPTLAESDLLALHADLYEYLNDGVTTASAYRNAAAEKIQRDLIKKARRPWLIFDSASLFDAHRALTLAMLYKDNRSSAGNGECKELAAEYLQEFKDEMASVTYREDVGGTGQIIETAQRSAAPVVMGGVGPNVNNGRSSYRRAL